ncbi:hypothetical protein MASR2M32_32500 [Sphaerotilus sulfidivorans]
MSAAIINSPPAKGEYPEGGRGFLAKTSAARREKPPRPFGATLLGKEGMK